MRGYTVAAKKTTNQTKSTKTSNKRIGKFDKNTNELLEEFDSILDAVHSMGRTSRVSIDQVLQGRHKYAYGFSWKYLD